MRSKVNKKGHAVASEYVLVMFLVIGMITAMTVYFKRAVQARIRDAGMGMADTIRREAGTGLVVGKFWTQYEPYYTNSTTDTDFSSTETETLEASAGLTSGIYRKLIQETRDSQTTSETLPPKDAD